MEREKDGLMNGWMDGRLHRWMEGKNEQKDGQVDVYIDRWRMEGWTVYEWLHRWMDGSWMGDGGWREEQMD